MKSFKKIYSWVLPHVCILCNYTATRHQDLCVACYHDLPSLTQVCPRCANPLPVPRQISAHLLCGECLKQPRPFDATYALYLYESPITKLILALKFNHQLVYARVLGELLAMKIQTDWYQDKPLPEIIIPVPLHPKRLQERGFNQALEIARPIARHLKLPVNVKACARTKYTAAQATLPANERQRNIKNAFAVVKKLSYQHIAVIDDVITTGNTISEFCQTLKAAGVKKIDVWCCARPCL